ncbi:MAG TPA: permease prefix domain 1-containing protein [Gaiellaceae bacterium]|nr:permease prefix domain 1-containing protein [Gaiellaceae bacterium]
MADARAPRLGRSPAAAAGSLTIATSEPAPSLEQQLDQWRSYLRRRQAIHAVDVAELEDHLREQIAALTDAGLAEDEAFLVAVKRLGSVDTLSREFAREHSDRLWKQLVMAAGADEPAAGARTDAAVALALATAAAAAVKLPALFGLDLDEDGGFYARNASLFALPPLAGYFAWKRRPEPRPLLWLAVAFLSGAVLANVYPLERGGSTEALAALHLPIALWLVVGVAYAGSRWRDAAGRMDFVRFSGEVLVYYALIALGGGVLTAFVAGMFDTLGIDAEPFVASWLLPCGAAGAVVVAGWLAEAKQSVIENMAPVLAQLFTPLFAALVLTFLGALLWTGRGVDAERELLVSFDLLLVVVLGLLLYSISARSPDAPPRVFDVLQVVLVLSALVADAVALWAIAERITELGFTPNRTAGLGVNVILLVNLAWSAVLYLRFLHGRGPAASIERWQTAYFPVYAVWAATVVVVFPPAFGYA